MSQNNWPRWSLVKSSCQYEVNFKSHVDIDKPKKRNFDSPYKIRHDDVFWPLSWCNKHCEIMWSSNKANWGTSECEAQYLTSRLARRHRSHCDFIHYLSLHHWSHSQTSLDMRPWQQQRCLSAVGLSWSRGLWHSAQNRNEVNQECYFIVQVHSAVILQFSGSHNYSQFIPIWWLDAQEILHCKMFLLNLKVHLQMCCRFKAQL